MGDQEPGRGKKIWATVRLLLGLAQIGGAVTAAYLLCKTGMSELALTATLFTCVCTSISVFLFGDWGNRGR
jgi:hypothetical protein